MSMDEIIKQTEKILGYTLETQNSDSLDFHELAVWQIKELLEMAYKSGAKNDN